MLIVVTGAPASGKSTWVRSVAKPGDLRFDSDALTNLLTGKTEGKHAHSADVRKVSNAAREAGIAAALRVSGQRDVYILRSNLSRQAEMEFRRFGARFVIIDPGEEEALRRCRAGRPGYRHREVAEWYARRDQWPADAEIITEFIPAPPEPNQAVEDEELTLGDEVPAEVHVVTGPPASGKTTFIREHSTPGDIVIDYDLIANVLAGKDPDNHSHTRAVKNVTAAARRAAIESAMKQAATVWIIHSNLSPELEASYRAKGATIHLIDPGKSVVMARVKQERPAWLLPIAAAWYDKRAGRQRRRERTTTEKGLGHRHQQQRERLLRMHTDGTPCWWCAQPMYRDKDRNFDRLALAADHSTARKHAGPHQLADRLLHGSCNSARKDGAADATRPAVQPRGDAAPGEAIFDW